MKACKRIVSIIVAMLMIVTSIPFVIAERGETSGQCGDNVYWSYDESTTTLTISGEGKMNLSFDSDSQPWSEYQEELQAVIIEEGVTSVGIHSFSNCRSMKNVTIANSVTKINIYAFFGCTALENVYYGGTEQKWNSITIENGNQCLINADIQFAGVKDPLTGQCGDNVHWSYDEDTATLTIGGEGEMWDFDIDNQPWLTYRNSIRSVFVENGVTSIGWFAFSSFSELVSVTIPNSVTCIGVNAFAVCSALPSIAISDGVKSISFNAFAGCTSLESVMISKSVNSIDEDAFGNCKSLVRFSVDESNPAYASDDSGCLYNKTKTELLYYPIGNERTSFSVPDTVTHISDHAFKDCDYLTDVTIPGSVKTLPDGAFSFCSSLTSVEIENGLESIGNSAFWMCENLQNVSLPNSVTSIGRNAFYLCYCLRNINIPIGLETIGNATFRYCRGLKEITIPKSVTTIESEAFCGCSSLNKVTILNPDCEIFQDAETIAESATIYGYPDSTAQAYADAFGRPFIAFSETYAPCGNHAFWSYDEATSTLTISGTGDMWDFDNEVPWQAFLPKIKHLIVEEGITSIGANALFGAYNLKTATLPDTLTSIGDDAFFACVELREINLPDGLQTIGDCAFEYCTSLETLNLPDSITTIGGAAFVGCVSLTSIKLPDGLTTLEDALFENCYSLETVEIPASVTQHGEPQGGSLGNVLFYCCDHLKTIINRSSTLVCADRNFYHYALPEGVDEELFWRYMKIGSKVAALRLTNVFTQEETTAYLVESLKEEFGENYESVLEPLTAAMADNSDWWQNPVKERMDGLTFNCYPNSAEHAYCESNAKPYAFIGSGKCGDAAFWSFDDNTKTLTISGEGSMYDYIDSLDVQFLPPWLEYDVENIVVENGITNIGDYSFNYMLCVKSVSLPNTLTRIGESAFWHCEQLSGLSIPNSVKTIGDSAFSDCYGLLNVDVPDGVEIIDAYAFYACLNVSDVRIPQSVRSIGERAFDGLWAAEAFVVDENNPYFSSDDHGCLYDKKRTNLIRFPVANTSKSYSVPNTVVTIEENAFWYCNSLESINLPQGIITIGKDAFTECNALKQVTIPRSVTDIGEKAFGYHTNGERYNDFSISGYIDSAAENYALENGIPFTLLYSGARVTGVSLNKTSITIEKGKTQALSATIAPSNAENKRVAWSSSNTSVATVDKNGIVTAKANGTATITVKTYDGGKTAACAVTVKTSVTGVTLNKTSADIVKGKTLQLTATINPNTASNKDKTWTSSNTNIATVSSSGLVTAKAVGSANITVKTNDGGKTAVCKVTVKPAVVNVSSVSLDKTSLKLAAGMNETLSATVSPSNATNKKVTWSSSNAKVARVDGSGKVTAVAEGTATITAKTADGNKTKKCSVTVVKTAVNVVQYPSTEAINYYNGKAYSVYNGAKVDKIPVTIKIINQTDTKKTVIVKSSTEPWFSLSNNSNIRLESNTYSIDGNSSKMLTVQVYPLKNIDFNGDHNIYNDFYAKLVTLDIYWDNVYNPTNDKCSDESKHISVSPGIQYKFRLNGKTDMFSFGHDESSFFKPGETKKEFPISKAALSKTTWSYHLAYSAYSGASWVMDGDKEIWGGACFGMSALLANLVSRRSLIPSFGANTISKLKRPAENISLRDAINILHFVQMFHILDPQPSERSLIRQLWDLLRQENNGNFPIIGVSRDGGRHSIMAYNMIDHGEYYAVDVIDPNSDRPQQLKLKHDLSGLYGIYWNGKHGYSHIIRVDNEVDIDKYAPGLIKSSKKSTVSKAKTEENSFDYTIILLKSLNEVTISNSENRNITINKEGEIISGNLDAIVDTVITGDDSPIIKIGIKEEGDPESYQITSSSDYVLSVKHDQVIGQVKVNGSEASCVTYSPKGLIKVEKDEGSEYEMSLYAYDMAGDVCHVSLSGDSATEASIENCESGILLSSDDLENETVSVDHYDDELSEDYVSSLAGVNVNEVLLKTDTDNTTELYINCDENPDHETKLNAHIYKKTVVEPTCTENGYYKYACTSCDDASYEEIPMLGHTPDEPVVENEVLSTCTSDGSYDAVVRCMDCGEVLNRETITLEASGHTPGDLMIENAVKPTCDRKESHDEVEYCVECGTELSRVTVSTAALGHSDEDNDGLCDSCNKQMIGDGRCKYCGQIHTGFGGFFTKIIHWFLALFGRTAHEVVS